MALDSFALSSFILYDLIDKKFPISIDELEVMLDTFVIFELDGVHHFVFFL